MVILTILFFSFLASLADLLGFGVLFLKDRLAKLLSPLLLAFAAGAMLSAAFFDLLPEVIAAGTPLGYVLLGILLFFFLEKGLIFYHCHDETCDLHSYSYMTVLGDFIHDFLDGVIIAVSFLTDFSLGLLVTLATIAHEIPSGIGVFGVVLHAKADGRAFPLPVFVLSTTLAAPLGALLLLSSAGIVGDFLGPLLGIATGGFLYVAATDLIPELHKEYRRKASLAQVGALLAGVAAIWGVGILI